jgi:putative Mg2+ transporter-C (MgtC) family protein
MPWLIESWHVLLGRPWDVLVLVIISVLCGGWVGSEREHKEKPAGLRTMALVALGSCTFTLVGYAFTSSSGDSGRVAAQIVTGIGFLGGGALFRDKSGVRGMTTAATIWVVAAIGMTVGAGYPFAGIGLAMIVRGVLGAVLVWENTRWGGAKANSVAIRFDPDHGKTVIKLVRLLDGFGLARANITRTTEVDGQMKWVISYELPSRHQHELLWALADMEKISSIEEGEMKMQ